MEQEQQGTKTKPILCPLCSGWTVSRVTVFTPVNGQPAMSLGWHCQDCGMLWSRGEVVP